MPCVPFPRFCLPCGHAVASALLLYSDPPAPFLLRRGAVSCAECKKTVNSGSVAEHKGEAYCKACHDKLCAPLCLYTLLLLPVNVRIIMQTHCELIGCPCH